MKRGGVGPCSAVGLDHEVRLLKAAPYFVVAVKPVEVPTKLDTLVSSLMLVQEA